MHVAQFAAPVRRQRPQTPQNAQQAHTLLAPSDEIRGFVPAANVAGQDATPGPAASAAPERVITQLAGSAESATYLFALCEAPPLGEVSELSYPLISSTDNPRECGIRGHAWPGGEPNFVGFIHLTLPLLEDTSIAEIECVLDIDLLPLPGESADDKTKQVTARLLASAEHIAAQLGRSRAQITVHHPADCPPDADPFYPAIIDSGYHRHLGHIQAYIPAEHATEQTHVARQQAHSGAENHPGYRLLAWRDYAIADEYAPQIRQLLTVASIDVPSGGMELDPIEWTPTRMEQAAQRLRDRGGSTLLFALVDKQTDKICALTEIARHYGSDPTVAEWTLTVTARTRRRQGLASHVKFEAIHAAQEMWPSVNRIYGSIPDQPGHMRSLYRSLGAVELSCSSTWENRLPSAETAAD